MARWSLITSCNQDPAQPQTPSKSCTWKAYPSKHPKCKGLLYTGRFFVMSLGKRLRTRRGGGRVVWGGDACVALTGGERHAQGQGRGRRKRPLPTPHPPPPLRESGGSSSLT